MVVNVDGITHVLEGFSCELCAIVRNDYLWNTEPVDAGVLNKPPGYSIGDSYHCFCFNPHREVVDSNKNELLLGHNNK